MEVSANGTRYLTVNVDFAKACRRTKLEIPELECTIIIQELNVAQLSQIKTGDLVGQLAMMIVDEDGHTIFNTPQELARLAKMPSHISEQIFETFKKFTATNEEVQQEILKN
jgi:hypothetical protein